MQKRKRRNSLDKDYINNKEFTALIIKDQDGRAISRRLMQLFTILVERKAKESRFKYYSYLDDMKQEGLLDCVKAIQKKVFDRKKDNGFAYFTTVVKNAFVRVIKSEAKQAELKWDNMMDITGGDPDLTLEFEEAIRERDERLVDRRKTV